METIDIVVEKNEERILPFVWTDDHKSEYAISVRLVGEGASVLLLGMFLGSKRSQLIFNTSVAHEAPRTRSLTTLRGVFRDNSSFSNDGLITIKKGAKGADGFFASKLLLFDEAKGKSVPSLQIDENDLKAGHASTVGRPDASQLFYLRSRGLSEKQAIELIVSGFFVPLLKLIPQKEREALSKRLPTIL